MDNDNEESILNRMRDGMVWCGKGAISSVAGLGKLGVGATVGLAKGITRHTGNALHSMSLATGFDHVINPTLPLSPMAADRKLAKYSKSYDLDGFMQIAQETSRKLGEVKTLPCDTDTSGTRTLNLSKLSSIGVTIRNYLDSGDAHAVADVKTVTDALGDISAEAKLAGPNGLQGKFHALYDEIGKTDSSTFHTPEQIIAAFQALQEQTLHALKEQKQEAIQKIKDILEPTTPGAPNNTQAAFQRLCNINQIDQLGQNLHHAQISSKIKEKVNQLIAEVEKEYDKAEKALNEYFNGTPSAGKDTPAVRGMTQRLEYEKEKAEADLLLRISHLERMLKRGYDISVTEQSDDGQGLTAIAQDEEEDKEHLRAACLKGITLQKLLEEKKWAGKYWGETKVNTLHTRNGLTLVFDEKTKSVTGLKIPPQWLLSDAEWEAKVQLALEDYISALKIDHKPGEKLNLKINHPVDSNRQMLIQATYRAAIKNGFNPDDLVFTVTGSKEDKGNFTNKPATDVLRECGLAADDPDLPKYQQERSELKKRAESQKQAMQTAVQELKFTAGADINEFKREEQDVAPQRRPRS